MDKLKRRKYPHEAVKRKADYVTALAVSFFILIVVFELLLVTWLPWYLRSKSIWERESAREEMVELLDDLRANFSSISKKYSGYQLGQISIMTDCLDQIARYLRTYGEQLRREQIHDLYADLRSIEIWYNRMRVGNFNEENTKIDPLKFMTLLAEKSGFTLPAPEKKEKEEKATEKKKKNETGKTQ